MNIERELWMQKQEVANRLCEAKLNRMLREQAAQTEAKAIHSETQPAPQFNGLFGWLRKMTGKAIS